MLCSLCHTIATRLGSDQWFVQEKSSEDKRYIVSPSRVDLTLVQHQSILALCHRYRELLFPNTIERILH
jgi:hypothetical protein